MYTYILKNSEQKKTVVPSFLNMLLILSGFFIGLVLSAFCFIYNSHILWEENFAKKRVSRRQKSSPSNKDIPNLPGWVSSKQCILNSISDHENFKKSCESDDELIARIQKANNQHEATRVVKINGKNNSTSKLKNKIIKGCVVIL